MNGSQKQLENRLDSIICQTYDLLALRNHIETSEKLLHLFDKASNMKAKLHEEAQSTSNILQELKQCAAESSQTNSQFEAAVLSKEKELNHSKKQLRNFVDLVSNIQEALAELQGIKSLVATQQLLNHQIAQLEDKLHNLTEIFNDNWKTISSSTFETTLNDGLEYTKDHLISKMEQKQQQLEAIDRDASIVTGEYQSLKERYIQLLSQLNSTKIGQIQNFVRETRTTTTKSTTYNTSQIKQAVEKGSIEVRIVKQKPNNQIEYAISVIFLFVTVLLIVGYYWK